jgi:hypothetical protein
MLFIEPDYGSSDVYGAHDVVDSHVVACGYFSILLGLGKEVLDQKSGQLMMSVVFPP